MPPRPFGLDAAGVAWVEATLARLSPDERVAQLFVLISRGDPAAELDLEASEAGRITRFFGPDLATELGFARDLIAASAVPPFLSPTWREAG